MAKDKKTFVAYTDWIDTFEELSNDDAGKLIKHLLRYVNDLNPEPPDILIKMCFIPIKQQLKRDLKRWEEIKATRSEAGKLGGRPKKQTKAKKANGFFEKQTKAKKAVNVNVNDYVNEEKEYLNQSFKNFVDWFNDKFNRNFKALDKLIPKYNKVLKSFSYEELKIACENAYKNDYHIKNNFEYLTVEFMLRPDKVDLYLNKSQQKRKFDEKFRNDKEADDFIAGRIKIFK